MTPESFISKLSPHTSTERAAAQEHFTDLCRLVEEPTPNEADPSGADYAFEKGVAKTASGRGFADVWKRNHFAIEYKKKGGDLSAAFAQLQRYSLALDNPPLLVVTDIDTIIIRTAWTNTVSEIYEIGLADIADPLKRRLLKNMMSDPERLRPAKTRQRLTEEAAEKFAELAQRLRSRGHDPQEVAHFTNRIIFCLFADHAGLLPRDLFPKFLAQSARSPARFEDYAKRLFGALATRGSDIDFTPVPWFNGGLFEDAAALPLRAEDIVLLQAVRSLDWADIDVAIFGTLFERGLDPDKRSQLGAHYTNREKIEEIIGPVIARPLRAEWAEVRVKIEAAVTAAPPRRSLAAAQMLYEAFIDRLAAFRVLDPACGSGNFLYLAVQALQDIEHLAGIEAEALGLQRAFARVGPEAVLGIEINPFAAELARISVWIGHIQWARRNGVPPPSDPVLRPLDTIRCQDAIINADGTPAAWPQADVIISNPPFLGAKLLKRRLGTEAAIAIRKIYEPRLPGFTDLVCYWFENARAMIESGQAMRAGLVATNSIRKNTNLPVLHRIVQTTRIFAAWSEEQWTVDGANVDVSIVCFGQAGFEQVLLNGEPVPSINADLTTGLDLTGAKPLRQNRDGAFLGIQKSGPFDVSGLVARAWLQEPINPNGRSNAEVLKPYWNGDDLTERPRDKWFIDLPLGLSKAEASLYASPFQYLSSKTDEEGRTVQMLRESLHERAGPRWWEPHWPRPEMRSRIAQLNRYIVTAETAQHRIFVWLSYPVLPDKNLIVVPREDDLMFGLLQNQFHAAWALRKGSDLENRPRYTHTTTFATFPFPEGMTPDVAVADARALPAAAAIEEAAKQLCHLRDEWLYPSDLVERRPEVAPGFPDLRLPKDASAQKRLLQRTMTALYNDYPTWLAEAHRELDGAVAAAYGWPADISTADALAELLTLNIKRSP